MNITSKQNGTVTVVGLEGRLDAMSAPDLEVKATALIESGAERMVIEMGAVDYISSAGLRALLVTAKRMQAAQGKLALAAVLAPVREVLEMAGFSSVIPVHDSVEAARADMEPTREQDRPSPCALSFAEELYLLALDDKRGAIKTMFAFDYALAGAVLMELALEGRVDSDAQVLNVISFEPVGVPLLDEALRELAGQDESQPASSWIKQLAGPSANLRGRVLASLMEKQILRQENQRVFWMFQVRRYPIVDDREIKEVRARLRELILSNEIPAPRDVVLISLGNTCQILNDLFTAEEVKRVQSRIDALARLDLIGQEMTACIRDIQDAFSSVSMPVL